MACGPRSPDRATRCVCSVARYEYSYLLRTCTMTVTEPCRIDDATQHSSSRPCTRNPASRLSFKSFPRQVLVARSRPNWTGVSGSQGMCRTGTNYYYALPSPPCSCRLPSRPTPAAQPASHGGHDHDGCVWFLP